MTMFKFLIVTFIFIQICVSYCDSSAIFHEGTKVTFYPDNVSKYFGYTVLLSSAGLIVGAPKAASRSDKSMSPGIVFTCKLDRLDQANVTCKPLGTGPDTSFNRFSPPKDFFRDDMWLGATIAMVPHEKLLICAPRAITPYHDKHFLANGVCYVQSKTRGISLKPLEEKNRQASLTDGARKEYGEYGTHLNFYAYGQAGMSIKVTENNTIIIGAPGLLQWTGGIIDYKFIPHPNPNILYFSKQPTTSPYYTKDLGPDDYFGYSVESGKFQLNGTTLYVAGAPRAKSGYGQVLIFQPAFRERDALNIKAKVRGPQLGSYFGATLCCTDIDNDGRDDLLVGAPNFVKKDGGLPYDQGAVFVYLSRTQESGFVLENSGYVFGSGDSGARFGSAIANLGDVDGDGYTEIAIGAPFENNGSGVVYIYRGSPKGLHSQYSQRIVAADGARAFGISISKGYDVDKNNCNDLAIGAHNSGTVYLYRCVPTMQVHASIKVPDVMDLPQNATNFTALFCITAPPKKLWPHVKIDLKATITIDHEGNRAHISADPQYNTTVSPGNHICDEQTVEVEPTADLSRPIAMSFHLEPMELMKEDTKTFLQHAARLSQDSTLHSSLDIQLTTDCGEDLICKPWLEMTLESLDSPYIPGSDGKLGAVLTILNKEEPAYGAKVHLALPSQPKRVPRSCTLEALNMTCEVPSPLHRMESVTWEIELEYTSKDTDGMELTVVAELEDPLYSRNITDETIKELVIQVTPEANFSVSGKALPNATLSVTRESLSRGEMVLFEHYFEITNFGPSDWMNLVAELGVSENVTLSSSLNGCTLLECTHDCVWPVPAKVSKPVILRLRFDLKKHAQVLEEQTDVNITTKLYLVEQNKTATITTRLVLEPAFPIWPLIVASVAGFLVLAAFVYTLYKCGFFSRQRRDDLERLKEQSSVSDEEPSCSGTAEPTDNNDGSSQELLSDDSDEG